MKKGTLLKKPPLNQGGHVCSIISVTHPLFLKRQEIFYHLPGGGFVSRRLFLQKALKIFSVHFLLAPFNEQNLQKKTSLELIQSYKHLSCSRPNWAHNGPFAQNQNYFWKNQYGLHVPLAKFCLPLLLCEILK